MSARKPEGEPSTSQIKRRRIDEEEQQVIGIDVGAPNQLTISKFCAGQNIDNLIAQLQEIKNGHNREIAKIVETHKKEMLKMTEKVERLEAEIAEYKLNFPIASNEETRPQIFKLDVDCVQEVFDWLSIEDIHSIAQACTRMQRIAGDYFETNLSALQLVYKGGQLKLNNRSGSNMTGFKEYIQKLQIGRKVNDEGYRFIGRHCKSLKQIEFYRLNLNATRIEYIKPILSKIETVILDGCLIGGEFYESFLKFCPRLKHLHIESLWFQTVGTNNEWQLRSYPTLEHLEWNVHAETPELGTFLERNPNLQKLSLHENGLDDRLKAMSNAKIKLPVLALINPVVGDILKQLYDQGFYQRLHLKKTSREYEQKFIDRVYFSQGLEKLYLTNTVHDNSSNTNLLTSITEIRYPIDIELPVNRLVNLERLFCLDIEPKKIESFIELFPKLKIIKVDYSKHRTKFIDLAALNKKREKLVGAKRVTIYLKENLFLATKWRSKATDFKLVALKREESFDWEKPFLFNAFVNNF